MKLSNVIVSILMFGLSLPLGGQTCRVTGRVTDTSGRLALEHAIVAVPALNYWTSSDAKGEFLLKQLPPGDYQLHCQMMGYKDTVLTCHLNEGNVLNLHILLRAANLSLKEVTVTARETTFGASSHISREAIAHLQPKSLNDVFQLLPGQLSENPDLKSPKQIRIRDLSAQPNAVGVLLMVNDMPVNNDGNMQAFSTSKQGVSTATPGTLGQGTDLRDLSAENIESVEVIRGIPSSEYGNLTSGVVRVTTKIGQTPYRVGLKTDLQSKIASVQKGINLPHNGGAMNLGADYTKAYDDVRMKSNGYERVTAHLAYANTFFRQSAPLRLKFNFSPYATLDENKTDPDLKKDEVIKSKKAGLRTGISGEWLLRRPWITNLEYNLSATYAHTEDYQKRLMVISSGAVPFPTSWVSGEYAADYLPGIFYAQYTMDGKPYNLSAKLKARLTKHTDRMVNRLIGGVEYNLNGNAGKGLSYDMARPPMNVLSGSSRPRPFWALPSLHHVAAFVEDRIRLKLGTSALTLQTGIRLASLAPGNMLSVEPRFIASYEILNRKNNNIVDKLAVNAGWGKTAKMPPLIYLSPDNSYFDDVALNHLDAHHGSLAIVNTTVLTHTANPNLKPMTNRKWEFGFEAEKGSVALQITCYSEHIANAYTFEQNPYIKTFRKFHIESGGIAPVFENNMVYYTKDGDKKAANVEPDTIFRIYRTPGNNEATIKRGIEYVIGFGKIEALQTTLTIDGAWMYQKQYTTCPYYTEIHAMHPHKPGKLYPYLPLMPAGESTVMQRFNSNIRSVTHIPAIRMIFSLTTQLVWNERLRYTWDDENGNPRVYYYDSKNGTRIDGSRSAYNNRQELRHVDPIAFLDYNGTLHTWEKTYSLNPSYSRMVETINRDYYFVEEVLPPIVQFNFRMTKEFNDNISLSFMVNNFFKMHPRVLSNRTATTTKKNDALYFGAELNIKI